MHVGDIVHLGANITAWAWAAKLKGITSIAGAQTGTAQGVVYPYLRPYLVIRAAGSAMASRGKRVRVLIVGFTKQT